MNQYAAMVERHWRRWLPSRVAAMDHPASFFSALGEDVAARIEDLATDLAGDDPAGETYVQKVGRLNMARLRAEEMVLPEIVLLPPEPGMEEAEDSGPEPPGGNQAPATSGH
jgi:hypothetical protein